MISNQYLGTLGTLYIKMGKRKSEVGNNERALYIQTLARIIVDHYSFEECQLAGPGTPGGVSREENGVRKFGAKPSSPSSLSSPLKGEDEADGFYNEIRNKSFEFSVSNLSSIFYRYGKSGHNTPGRC